MAGDSVAEPPRLNGPNMLCIGCGAVSNHVSLLCTTCRVPKNDRAQTNADRAYLEWKRQRDAGHD